MRAETKATSIPPEVKKAVYTETMASVCAVRLSIW